MNIDMELLLDAVRDVESSGGINLLSPRGAKGPYQFMDATAAEYGVADPYDEKQSRDGARRYLTDLMKRFGSVEHALVAYNGGPTRLANYGNNIAAMPEESQNYLSKVMRAYAKRISESGDMLTGHLIEDAQPVSPLARLSKKYNGKLFSNEYSNEALRQSVSEPRPLGEAQRIYELQLQTGLPAEVISRNLDEIEKKVRQQNFNPEEFRANSPLLAEWLEKNPTRAALAQGDYENLSFLEKTWATLGAAPKGAQTGIMTQQLMILNYKAVTGALTAQEEAERNRLKMEIQKRSMEDTEGLPSWAKEAGSIIGIQIPMVGEAAKKGILLGLPAGAAAGAVTGLIGGPGAPATVTAGAAAGGLLGARAFATASYIEQSYMMSVGEAFDELESAKDAAGNPIDPVAARYAALLVGVPNAALEFASLRAAIKVIPGADMVLGKLSTGAMKQILVRPTVMAALKDFSVKYAAAVGTETFTEGMQKLLAVLAREITTGDYGAGFSQYDVGGIVAESVAAFKGSAVLGILGSGPKVIELYADMQKAQRNTEAMRALGDITANSKTYANSPKAFSEYVAHLKENGPVKNVFIPIEQWNLLFQDKASDAAREVFGGLDQYAEAETTGGDLVIPLEKYAEKLAGTEFHQALLPNTRFNPGEMTYNEALEAQQAEPEIAAVLQQEMDELIAKEAPLQTIYDDVYTKLLNSGATEQEAVRDATLWKEHYRGLTSYFGIDPVTEYQKQPLTIQRPDPTMPEKLVTYNQQLVEPAVPNAQRLPLVGGEINLPPATEQEVNASQEAIAAASQSEADFGVFGATIHPTKGNLAGTPGVAVAGYPQRGVITEGYPTAQDLEVFMRKNRDIFEADPNAALGVWVDSESGKGYLDITNVLPRDMAIEQGEYLGEKAVWDLEHFEEIRLPIERETGQGVLFQSAFHGSPHNFDKFSLEHIGRGEGAQAFGYGLYFASNKEISEWYRKKLVERYGTDQPIRMLGSMPIGEYIDKVAREVNPKRDWNETPYIIIKSAIVDELEGTQGLTDLMKKKWSTAIEMVYRKFDRYLNSDGFAYIDRFGNDYDLSGMDAETVEAYKTEAQNGNGKLIPNKEYAQMQMKPSLDLIDSVYRAAVPVAEAIENKNPTYEIRQPSKGQLYEVELPDDEHLMIWEKRIGEQPKVVQEALNKIKDLPGMRESSDFDLNETTKAENWYYALATWFAHNRDRKSAEAMASAFLAGAGVKGHKYLDASGRTGKKKSYNFVIYDDAAIEITKKYYQSAFHGSPYRFDNFSLEHLGRGEGAQAFGWGLYFAGKRAIAEHYRERLSNLRNDINGRLLINGVPLIEWATVDFTEFPVEADAKLFVANALRYRAATQYNVKDGLQKEFRNASFYFGGPNDPRTLRVEQLINEILEADITFTQPDPGQLYEVNIPEDDVLLDYNATLENQPPKVQEVLKEFARQEHISEKEYHIWDGEVWYYAITGSFADKYRQGQKEASLYLNSKGVLGLKYLDAASRNNREDKTYNYVIFDDKSIEIIETFYQGERGFSVPMKNLIGLLKDSDPSTFMHESAHLWLVELRQFALRPDAPEQLKADWEATKIWAGIEGDEFISTEAHERFARGFEKYLMEGEAPSFRLRELFAQLKEWMIKIYQAATMIDVELTPEIVGVFDRLIAAEDLVKQSRERSEYHIPLLDRNMMTEAEYEAYRDLNTEAKRKAEDTFRAKVMKDLRNEKLQIYRDKKKAYTEQVRKELLEQPIHKAAYWLYSGKLPNGEEIPGLTSHKLDKQALLDMGADLKDFAFRYSADGIHPDIVAGMFGFPSGETMVREMAGMPSLKESIDLEVAERIREESGGIIIEGVTDEQVAMEVQNTQQIDVFNMELRILKRLGARREATHPAVLKDLAARMISRKTLRELDPRVFEEAALRAGQDAQDALLGQEFRAGTGRNLDAAFDAKQRQLLNLYLQREALEKRTEADRSVKVWRKILSRSDERISKYRNMDMVNAARAIASVHGIGGASDTAMKHLAKLAEYDPDTYDDLKDLVEMASGDGRDINDLTVAEFQDVKNAIEGLWKLARRSKQIEIDGVKMERAQVTGELKDRISELSKPDRERAGYHKDVSNWDKTKMALLGARAMLRRVEHWVDAMDDGSPAGKFRKYIWQPVSEAADMFREQRRLTLEKYKAIAEQYPKESANVGEIDAYEIQYKFKNKASLLAALLHTGNESNLQKLIRGREWGAYDQYGELDTSKWDAFISRMQEKGVLTKADYDFVQSVWDLFEELKPAAQKTHKEVYGYYFEEITAKPFTTPFGNYRGGYVAALVDPYIVEDVAIRGEKEALEKQPTSFIFPSTGRGFTKKRNELYAKPLMLDIGLIPQQLEKVLKFTYLQAATRDVSRVVIDKDFRNHLAQLDSEVGAVMLVPWLQRSALQQVEQPSGPRLRAFDKIFHAVRTNTGMQIMFVNLSNTLQQLTGIASAVVKVEPRYLAGSLVHFIQSPTTYRAQMNDASLFMRNRNATQLMDVQTSIDNILLHPNKYAKAKAWFNQHGYFMQQAMQNFVDAVVWGGAYEQATSQGMDEKTAIRQADSAVRETQGTFSAEDISRFEAGPAHLRVFTMFYSYFNMMANLNATEFTKAMRQSGFAAGGRALYIYTFGYAIPAIMAEAIAQTMRGELFDDEDDDGYLDNILSLFFGSQVRMGTAMIPVIGPAAQAGINMHNDKWYDDRISLSPAVSTLEASGRVVFGYDAYKLATEENARLKRPVQDLFTLIGMATGLPVAPLAKPIGYLTDVEQGHVEKTDNPIEFTRGLISGRAPQ